MYKIPLFKCVYNDISRDLEDIPGTLNLRSIFPKGVYIYMVSIVKRPLLSTLTFLFAVYDFIKKKKYIFMNEYQISRDIPNDVTATS